MVFDLYKENKVQDLKSMLLKRLHQKHPLIGPIAREIHEGTSVFVFTLLRSSTANKQLGSMCPFIA